MIKALGINQDKHCAREKNTSRPQNVTEITHIPKPVSQNLDGVLASLPRKETSAPIQGLSRWARIPQKGTEEILQGGDVGQHKADGTWMNCSLPFLTKKPKPKTKKKEKRKPSEESGRGASLRTLKKREISLQLLDKGYRRCWKIIWVQESSRQVHDKGMYRRTTNTQNHTWLLKP